MLRPRLDFLNNLVMRPESKSFHRAVWLGFVLVLMMIVVQSLFAQLRAPEGIQLTALSSFVVTTLGCIGVTGYALNRRIGPLLLWQVLFFVTVFGIASIALSLLIYFKTETLGRLLLAVVLSGPIAYGLFRYSFRTPHLWPEQPVPEHLALIEDALLDAARFEATKNDPGNSAFPTVHVSLYRDGEAFIVRIRRCNDAEERAYLNRFDSLSIAVAFILANTPVVASDLVRVA